MIRILIDADLILEALMNRNNSTADAKELLERVHPSIQIYLTDAGLQKIYAYACCLKNSQIAEIVVDWLQERIQICVVDQAILQTARLFPLKDFESAVELICLNYLHLDAIVTHKPEDFTLFSNMFRIWTVGDLWLRVNLENQLRETISNYF